MMRIVFILGCLFLIIACEKEAKVKLPETKSLPVLYSYICPGDTVIRLKLMYSAPLYSSNQIDIMAAVPDGDVRISGAQGTAQLVFNPNTDYYELQTTAYPIVPGQTYKMTVTTINGVATAETQVPLTNVPINEVTVETIQEPYGETSDRIQVSFTDEQGRENYYRIAALHAYIYTSQTDTLTDDTRINELYSDIGHDGGNVSLSARYYLNYIDSSQYYSAEYYDVFLYNCSSSYYSFHKSIKNYSGDNPFSEPALIYTNVKGGFGCFGAYVSSGFRYKKK
jgi:hypothetical protein